MYNTSIQLGPILKMLRKVPRDMMHIMEILVDTDARGFVADMVKVTPPSMGQSNSESKQRGENATASDISTVYGTAESMYALVRSYAGEAQARYYWYLVNNDPVRLQRWLDLSAPDPIRSLARGWDGGAAHRERRTRKGRVKGSKPSVLLSQGAERRELEKYIKIRKARVGLLAAGFNAAAVELGVKLPAWIRRHGSPFSLVTVQRTPGTYSVRITNRTPYVMGTDVPRRIRFVLASGKRKKRLIHRAKGEIRAILKKQGGKNVRV